MPSDKSKKTTSARATRNPKAAEARKDVSATNVPVEQPQRQSQFATILIGLLIIASGLLIYNYFQSVNQPATKTSDQAQNQTDNDTDKNGGAPTPTPDASKQQPNASAEKYTVVAGDSLWSVAEDVYGDGHQWRQIADANQLQTDSSGRPVIEVGQQLTIPGAASSGSVAQAPTPTPTVSGQAGSPDKLAQTPDTAVQEYTVQRGDTLWGISEKVYGDGHQWQAIFNDPHNRLGHLPDGQPLIHAGNVLYIPQLL